jgi:mercuric ion binding protein
MLTRIQGLGVLLAALALCPAISSAEILRADLSVNGMACPFCAFGIEKKLRAVDGVEKVAVLLDEGELRLTLGPGNVATVSAFEEAVDSAGFELGRVRIEVRGEIRTGDGVSVLEASDSEHFRLLEMDGERVRPITDTLLRRILGAADEESVVIEGTVEAEEDGLRGLVVATPGAPG